MSVARNERGATRTFLLLGLVLCGAGIVWLAESFLSSSVTDSTRRADSVQPNGKSTSPQKAPPLAIGDSKAGRTGAALADDPTGPEGPAASAPSVPTWAACLDQQDLAQVRGCLQSRLEVGPDPQEIASFLCSDDRDRHPYDLHVILVSEALARIPPSQALDWIDQVQLGCRRYQESTFLIQCLSQREQEDPSWIAGLRETLTPDRLFRPEAGEAGIQITTLFLKEGDLEVRQWIEEGARGQWGGTPEQIDRAIGISLPLQSPGTARLTHLRSVIASAGLPVGGATGSTFVHALLDADAWPDRDSTKALDTLMAVLYDERFQESAAATMCLSMPVDPPMGCDPATWSAIRARAIEIANQIGLVMPGSKH